ncbi:MAG TPA: sugar phosphate isomerase/epimerase [Candidatus Hydrogenedentes bacterium]|nr:sugar phosphate isomerase/epimerase [Candidatus Hydrogenedentota bacterium]
MKIVMHSYTMRDFPREKAFAHASACAYDGIELQRVHFKEDYLEVELPECLKLSAQHDLPIHCVDFTGDLTSDDSSVREESLRIIEKNIKVCGEHQIPIMNGFTGFLVADPDNWGANGSAIATDTHFDRAAEGLKHLATVAAQAKVTLTLEIHMNTIHDTVAATARLLDAVQSDHLLANPDPGNAFATSTAEKSPEALDQLGDRIGYFHLKNCRSIDGKFSYDGFLDDGDIEFAPFLEKLDALGYRGPVCIEYVGSGDAEASAKLDLPYLRSIMPGVVQ